MLGSTRQSILFKMIGIILFILAHPVLLFLFFRTTKEFPKSWWEFKFEVKTILCGLRSQNEDLFLRRRNRISWVDQSISRSLLDLFFLLQSWLSSRIKLQLSPEEIEGSVCLSLRSCYRVKWPSWWVRTSFSWGPIVFLRKKSSRVSNKKVTRLVWIT